MTPRRYAIIGTGAVGGYYGAKLAASGAEVWFVARSDAEQLRSGGLHVSSPDGAIDLPKVNVATDPAEVPPVDVVILATKTTGNATIFGLLQSLVGLDTVVIVMQNGFGVDGQVAAAVPDATVLGGLCFICSTRIAPGRIQHLDYGSVMLAEHRDDGHAAGITKTVDILAAEFAAAGVEVSPRPDLLAARWQKLVWNMPFNGMSVVLDAGTDELMANPHTREMAMVHMDEVVSIAAAHGHPVGDGFTQKMMSNTESMKPYATSMKLDFDAGRPMELAAIYDVPLAVAEHLGVPVPGLSTLAAQLHFLDARRYR